MEEGITIEEACATNSIGTPEDFELNCNPDGTVKNHTKTTTFSLRNSDNSVTIKNTYLQIGLSVAVITIIVMVGLVIRKMKQRTR